MGELETLRKRIKRERAARQEAEKLLEQKAIQLYRANEQLKTLNQNLEGEVRRKTSELERQKEQYQMLVDDAQDIIFVLSKDGYFKYVNPIALKIVAYTPEELQKTHFTQLIAPDHVKRVEEFYYKQVAEQTPRSYLEFPIICGDERQIWIGQNVNLQILDGEVLEFTAIARDISERVNKDREISELNLRLSAILSNLQEGILLEDENRRIVLTNKEFCKLFQIPVSPAELIGADCSQSSQQAKHLFENPEGFVKQVDQILADRKMVLGNFLKLADGRIFERDFIPIYNQDLYVGHLWRYQDVTEQKQSETKIKQSEEKYRGIIENMNLGLLEVDPKGVIVKPYPRFCEMTGYTADELIGKRANDIFLPEGYQDQMAEQDQNRQQGQSGVYEIQLQLKDKKKIWAMISGAPYYDEKGNMIGSIGIHYDITHQKELQHELELARKEAERARDAEKDFLANMSHEIRNPINSVVGMANLLFDTPLNEEQREYLNNIKYSSDLLLALISDILDISKITEGKMEPDQQRFDLRELVQVIANTTKFRLRESPVDFHLAYDPKIPPNLSTDITFLNQILMNLVSNAIKFTHEGRIKITTKLMEETTETALVAFSVEDTGIGIATEQLGHIFERFNQAGKAIAGKYGGTGLGLPITKKLINLLAGSIEVQSTLGEGTLFSFQIPFPKCDTETQASLASTMAEPDLQNEALSVLIVEDNAVNRLYLERILKKWNYHFHSCKNGKEALDSLQKEKYDLILMDIRMPEMDGYETTIWLRSNQNNPNAAVPIIALTASALKDEKEEALKAGMNYHLTKPFTKEQLQAAISQFFTSQASQDSKTAFRWPEPMHAADLEELYGDDLEHALLIFQVFSEEMPAKIQALGKAIQAKNWSTAGDVTHQIMPHFKMVGWNKLSDLMQQMEDSIRMDTPLEHSISEMYRQLERESKAVQYSVSQAITKLQSYLNQTDLHHEVSDRR